MIKLKKIYKIKSTVFILVLIFLLFSSCNNKITTAPSYLIDTPTTKWASPEQQRQAFFDKLGLTYTTKLVFTPACKHLEHVNFDDLIVNENDKNYYKTLSAQYAQIPEGYVAPIYIQWINHTIGHGVFALQAIEKNDYILAYTGQVQKFNSNTTWCWDYQLKVNSGLIKQYMVLMHSIVVMKGVLSMMVSTQM